MPENHKTEADTASPRRYRTIAQVIAVVRGFESCTTQPLAFTHQFHLTVALWYLSESPLKEAAERMRASLLRFIEHNNLRGYNETITLFWMKLLNRRFIEAKADTTLVETINNVIEACSESRIVFDYYSRERLSSEEAKAAWVEPDLRPLDF